MERFVQVLQPQRVVDLEPAVVGTTHLLEVGFAEARCGLLGCETVEHCADRVEVAGLIEGEEAHACPASGKDLDEPRLLETDEGFAHWCAAHPEAVRDLG